MRDATLPITEAQEQRLQDALDPGQTRAFWWLSRVAWALMALLIVAALAGLMGSGPLSRATRTVAVTGNGRALLEYPRFTRYNTEESMQVTVEAPDATGDTLQMTLSPALNDQLQIRDVTPPPDSVSMSQDGAVYEWSVEDWSQPVLINISFYAGDWGRVRGDVGVAAGDAEDRTLGFDSWVFP